MEEKIKRPELEAEGEKRGKMVFDSFSQTGSTKGMKDVFIPGKKGLKWDCLGRNNRLLIVEM